MKRKILSLLIVGILIIGLTGCGNNNSSNVNTSSTVTENSATVTFKYQDGETDDTTSIVKKTKTPTAYKIGNTRYDPDSMLLVLQDYQLEYIFHSHKLIL